MALTTCSRLPLAQRFSLRPNGDNLDGPIVQFDFGDFAKFGLSASATTGFNPTDQTGNGEWLRFEAYNNSGRQLDIDTLILEW